MQSVAQRASKLKKKMWHQRAIPKEEECRVGINTFNPYSEVPLNLKQKGHEHVKVLDLIGVLNMD